MTLWCSSKLAQLYNLAYVIKYIFNPSAWNIDKYCTLDSEYLPRPSASGNIPTLGAIFIDFHAEGLNIYNIYICGRTSSYMNMLGGTLCGRS